MESRAITFTETPPHLLPPPSKLSPLQGVVPPSWDLDDDTWNNDYISDDDLLRDVRIYTGVLNFTANIPAYHENASGESADPQVQELADQIRDPTRRRLLTPSAPSSGAASPAEPMPGVVRNPLSEGASLPCGGGTSTETAQLSPAPEPATIRKGVTMRNNNIPRPNVVTRRATVELTDAVTRYRGVRPNNNSNNNNASTTTRL